MTEVIFIPRDRAMEKVSSELDSAKESIRLAMFHISAYIFTKPLIDAHNRGIDVRIILDHEQAKQSHSRAMQLLRNNLNVRFMHPRRAFFHAKFWIIDSRLLFVGSTNLTSDAFIRNFEDLIITDDPSLVGPFIKEFERLFSIANPYLDRRMKINADSHIHKLPSGKKYWHPKTFKHKLARRLQRQAPYQDTRQGKRVLITKGLRPSNACPVR